jgi:hypothetical protein
MKHAFPYPLPEAALEMACNLQERHELHKPRRKDGLVFAGNGFLAIRVRKGNWIDEEIEPMDDKAGARFDSLPWGRLDALLKDGRDWVEISRGFRLADPPHLWHERTGRFNRTPAYKVRKAIVPLSILGFIARFPRAEINLDHTSPRDPLFFRFSAGEGIVPPFLRPPEPVREIFKPRFDPLTGEEIHKKRPPAKIAKDKNPTVRSWPPPDLSDV